MSTATASRLRPVDRFFLLRTDKQH